MGPLAFILESLTVLKSLVLLSVQVRRIETELERAQQKVEEAQKEVQGARREAQDAQGELLRLKTAAVEVEIEEVEPAEEPAEEPAVPQRHAAKVRGCS